MKNSLSVRRMNYSDVDVVKYIYSDSFEKEVCDVINYNTQDIYVVCYLDEVIGMCMVNYIDDIFIEKRTAFINAVCVDKNFRGKGVGSFLISEIEKIAYLDGASEIMLTSSSKRVAANRLYEKLGFNIYDTNVFRKKLELEQ